MKWSPVEHGILVLLAAAPVPGQQSPASLSARPEPAGWLAGDAHVHLDCGIGSGHEPLTAQEIFSAMPQPSLAVVSLLAEMGNGEVRQASRDLPQVNGRDFPLSTKERILRWICRFQQHFPRVAGSRRGVWMPKGTCFTQPRFL